MLENVKILVTVFTPTYNRVKLLANLYASLTNQSSYNFKWMVIDDGSTDNTEEQVRLWQQECKLFKIEYYKKENGGLQSAYVEAISHLDTELAMCIDSDDCATPDAIKLVEDKWNTVDHAKYAGLYGLDCYDNGEILGGYFADDEQDLNLLDFTLGKIKRSAQDRALVVRSDMYKSVRPAKRYPGERTMNATYLHLQIAEKYLFALLNKPLIKVEYQTDGLSKSKKKHYKTAPNTFADWRIYMLHLSGGSFSFYFRNAIHYVSSCILAKRKIFAPEVKHKGIIVLALPFGWLLYHYLRSTQ